MRGINFGRVILGGIVAGIVNNILAYVANDIVLKGEHEVGMKVLGKTVPMGGSTIATWSIMSFVFGIGVVWLYAAIRPRYGAGIGTAVRAGVAFWFFSSLFLSLVFWNLTIFPLSPMQLIVDLVVSILTAVAGAWLYKEDGAAA